MASPLPTKIAGRTGAIAEVASDGSLNVVVTDMPAVSVGAPVGGATEAKQDTMITHVDGIEALLALVTATSGGKTTVSVGIDITSATTTTIVAADATRKIKIVGIILFSSGINAITLLRGATALCGKFDLVAQSGFTMNIGNNTPIFETAVNEAFRITTTAATQLSGVAVYFLEA